MTIQAWKSKFWNFSEFSLLLRCASHPSPVKTYLGLRRNHQSQQYSQRGLAGPSFAPIQQVSDTNLDQNRYCNWLFSHMLSPGGMVLFTGQKCRDKNVFLWISNFIPKKCKNFNSEKFYDHVILRQKLTLSRIIYPETFFLGFTYSNVHANVKKWFFMLCSQEIGISFQMIFQALQSEILRIKFH